MKIKNNFSSNLKEDFRREEEMLRLSIISNFNKMTTSHKKYKSCKKLKV